MPKEFNPTVVKVRHAFHLEDGYCYAIAEDGSTWRVPGDEGTAMAVNVVKQINGDLWKPYEVD